jgi:hypothetical protein
MSARMPALNRPEVAAQFIARAKALIRMPDARGDVHQSPVGRGSRSGRAR